VDWITLLIEAVGLIILLLWSVIPVQEFRQILKVMRARRASDPDPENKPEP
jgi:hypothetical protein